MRLSEIFEKMARGEPFDIAEMTREVEQIENAASLVNSWLVSGSSTPFIRNLKAENIFIESGEIRLGEGTLGDGFSGVRIGFPAFTYNGENWNIAGIEDDVLQVGIRASDGQFVAGGGNVIINNSGIEIRDDGGNQYLSFYDELATTLKFYIAVDSTSFNIRAFQQGEEISLVQKLTDGSTPEFTYREDPVQDNRTQFNMSGGAYGGNLGIEDKIGFYAEGGSGGATFAVIKETTNTPPTPTYPRGHMYIKGGKLVVQYEDSGLKYHYINLNATSNQSWTYSATAP